MYIKATFSVLSSSQCTVGPNHLCVLAQNSITSNTFLSILFSAKVDCLMHCIVIFCGKKCICSNAQHPPSSWNSNQPSSVVPLKRDQKL